MKWKSCLILTLLFGSIIFSACKKASSNDDSNGDSAQGSIYVGDTLSTDQEAELETYSVPNPSLENIMGLDGNPVGFAPETNGIKGKLINNMIKDAQQLCDMKKTHLFPSEGENKPSQKGYVYSYGQRNFEDRLNPPAGNALHRKYSVYGTDCSGFIINLLRNAGVNIVSTDVANFKTNLLNAFKNDDVYTHVRLYDMGANIPVTQLRPGDFILWPNHIGLVCILRDGSAIMYQCNGTGFPKDEADQAKNLESNRGIHSISLDKAVNGRGYWGNNYYVLRLVEAGDFMQGGLLFYLDDDGKHGYVCSKVDVSCSNSWGSTNFTDGTQTEVGSGAANTQLLADKLGNKSAAGICEQLQLEGFDDWFLPSKDELNFIYFNLQIPGLRKLNGKYYLSSSDLYDPQFDVFWGQDLTDGRQLRLFKNESIYCIIAIRRF